MTHIFNQLDRILVYSQIDYRSMSTNVKDGIEFRSFERREFLGVLDQVHGGSVVEELCGSCIIFEHFDGSLRGRVGKGGRRIRLLFKGCEDMETLETNLVQRSSSTSGRSKSQIKAILEFVIRMSQFRKVPSGGFAVCW